MKNNELKRLSRELQCEGFITKYYKDTVKLPNGKTAIYDFVGHNGAAAAVAVLDDGRLLMVSQYRNALDRFTIEIPAGGLEPGEPTIKAAAREVEEERMVFLKIAQVENIELTDELYQEKALELATYYGYTDVATFENDYTKAVIQESLMIEYVLDLCVEKAVVTK